MSLDPLDDGKFMSKEEKERYLEICAKMREGVKGRDKRASVGKDRRDRAETLPRMHSPTGDRKTR